jgi:hypothetical protein
LGRRSQSTSGRIRINILKKTEDQILFITNTQCLYVF